MPAHKIETRYLPNQIQLDYGAGAFQKALSACKKQAAYYATLGLGRFAHIEWSAEEYSSHDIKEE